MDFLNINKRVTIFFIVALILQFIPSFISDNSMHWHVGYLCDRLEIGMWALLIFIITPYKHLYAKSILFSVFVLEFIELPVFLLNLYSYPLYFTKAIIFISGIAYIWSKSYESNPDELDNGHFFLVGIKPRNFRELILSFFKDPVGGVGVYAQGKFYHYRKDYLNIDDVDFINKRQSKYRIIKKRKIDHERLHRLKSLKGSKYEKWSLKYNCMTVLEPIISKRGEPLL